MSMTTGHDGYAHPIVWFSTRVHAVLDGLAGSPAWSMTRDDQRTALVELARAEARMAELRLRVLAAADRSDIAADTAATSTAAWVAHATRQPRSAAHAERRLAVALDTDHGLTRDALAAGLIDAAQARVIVTAVQGLPEQVCAADRRNAEEYLLELASQHDARTLKGLGRHVFEVIDPEGADQEEGRRLAAEDEAAARSTYLHMYDNGDGTHTGRFKIPTLHAAMLAKGLQALISPSVGGAGVGTEGTGTDARPGDATDRGPLVLRTRRTRPELLGEAFCLFLERFPADHLPKAGGMSATVVVTLDYDKLLTGIGAAHLDTGHTVSAAEARRVACESGIIPAVYRKVLGGPSVVLDLGRRSRFHTEPQRIALALRDGGCTAVGCDRPPGWCHAHHDRVPWSQGGGTSVDNGRLLCAFHHGRAHSPAYDATRTANGKVEFHRRT